MTRPRAVEVLGPWLHNKGDVLNIWALAERLGRSFDVAISSSLGLEQHPAEPPLLRVRWGSTARDLRSAVRVHSVPEMARSARTVAGLLRLNASLRLLSGSALRTRGFVPGRQIRALLDCSGYAYGDGWSTRRMVAREAYYRRLKQQGARVILLPQALGPFENPAVREHAAALFEHADLIFARDRVSLDHTRGLGIPDEKLSIAPDVTHLLAGIAPERPEAWARRVCVVPNARMLDKASATSSARYVGFMLTCLREVRAQGLEPVLLLHETNDLPLAEEIRSQAGFPVDVIDEDARRSKGILGACYAVIGSRYHAVISALSQGTPVIGTSWSHKYEELFGEYGVSEHLLLPTAGDEELQRHLQQFLALECRTMLKAQLQLRAAEQKARVEAMWRQVERLIAHDDAPALAAHAGAV